MANRSILFVPSWVADAFKRNKLPLTDLLNFTVVRKVLSPRDIAGVCIAQSVIAKEVFNTDHGGYYIYSQWQKTAMEQENKNFLDNTLNVLEHDVEVIQELKDRLFTVDSSRNTDSAEASIKYDLSPELGAIVIKEGFDLSSQMLKSQALEAVIQSFYAYMPYNEVAKTPWFRQYLEVLKRKPV